MCVCVRACVQEHELSQRALMLRGSTPVLTVIIAGSRELAIIHARENIRVNALCPGPLRTPLLMDFLNTEEKRQRRMVHLPMGRFGTFLPH